MKIIYDKARAPNPRRVRIFLAEKGIEIPVEHIDLGALEHKSEAFAALNPMRRLPVLVLDDGTPIAESIAICRYFEAVQPEPALFGRHPKQIALIEMWQRRMELHLLAAIQNVFRHSHPAMKAMEPVQIPEWSEVNRPRVTEALAVLDAQLGRHRFVAGDDYSVADITALVAVDFMKPVKIGVPPEMTNVLRWHAEVSTRPSAKAQ
ncbi:MAG: glutathione S-transferase [Pseudorhodoplanes sp.]|nr:glutathione S-transferase [Pseudorhodoplanes sp.]